MPEGFVEQETRIVSGHALASLDQKSRVELIAARAAEIGNSLGCRGYKIKSTVVTILPKSMNVEIVVRGRKKKDGE